MIQNRKEEKLVLLIRSIFQESTLAGCCGNPGDLQGFKFKELESQTLGKHIVALIMKRIINNNYRFVSFLAEA